MVGKYKVSIQLRRRSTSPIITNEATADHAVVG